MGVAGDDPQREAGKARGREIASALARRRSCAGVRLGECRAVEPIDAGEATQARQRVQREGILCCSAGVPASASTPTLLLVGLSAETETALGASAVDGDRAADRADCSLASTCSVRDRTLRRDRS